MASRSTRDGTAHADALFRSMEHKDVEQNVPTAFLVEKLGRGIRILSANVETPELPSKMKVLLARLAKVDVLPN